MITLKTNQFGLPIKNVEWYHVLRVLKIESCDDKGILHCDTGKGIKKLFISFPVGGGIRLCSERPGYFEPVSLKKLYITEKETQIIFSSDDGTVACVKRDTSGLILELSTVDGSQTLTIDGSQIMFGYDGDNWCKAAYSCPLKNNEGIYGFGERFNTLNHRGTHFSLWNWDCWSKGTAAYKNMPVFHSTEGYMMFFNSFNNCEVDVGETDPDKMFLEFEGPKWDAYYFLGTPTENLKQYTQLTGKPILPPMWALRYWAGGAYQVWEEKLGPENYLEAVQQTLDKYAEMGMPDIAALGGEGKPFNNEPTYKILEKTGTRMIGWNHPSLFIADMAKLLGTYDLKEIPYFMDPKDKTKQAGREVIDFAHPNAKKVIAGFFRRFCDWGLKGCMVDYGEILPVESLSSNGMFGDEMHNGVSYWYNKAYYDAWSEEMGDDFFLFSRSGCAGCQKWICSFGGDQVSTFEGLNQALNGMLNLTACGFSVWGTDIGGYGGPPSEEVYIRWLQFGAFNPVMRAHGAGLDRNPWTYGDTAIEVFKKMYWVRENLLFHIYSNAIRSHLEGTPMVMNMTIAFSDHGMGPSVNGQYMFCEKLMVCPVTEEGSVTKEVVFPKGNWYELFTGEIVSGGITYTVPAALDSIPVYIKAGSVILLRLGESGRLGEPVYADSFTPSLLITPPDADAYEAIYTENHEKIGCNFTLEQCGYSLNWEESVAYSKLVLYTKTENPQIIIDGAPISSSCIEVDAFGRIIVSISSENWKQLTVLNNY